MSASTKKLFIIGLFLTTLGSLLPWQQKGDLFIIWVFGLRIFPSIEDNGGLLILLLSASLAALIFRPPKFIEKPAWWGVALSVVLTFDSVFHIVSWMIDRSNVGGIIGAPVIQIGLIMVFIGSVTLLIMSLLHYRKVIH